MCVHIYDVAPCGNTVQNVALFGATEPGKYLSFIS